MQAPSEGLYAERSSPFVAVPLVVLVAIVVAASGFMVLGAIEHQDWSFLDCVYFTVISLTTVGYGETLPNFDQFVATRIYTMVVLVLGYGVMVWAFSSIIAMFVEGRFSEVLGRRRMMREIDQLRGHYILCGVGETGIHVLEEMTQTRRDVVVIERSRDRLAAAVRDRAEHCWFLDGDAESEEILRAAGIEHAVGFVACLAEDKDNVYLVLTARQLNPRLRIVARAIHLDSRAKLLRAGADAVISPNAIGGLRMASEMMRPTVTTFLDLMLRDRENVIRIEEVSVPEGSRVTGKSIGQVDIRNRTGLSILATTDHTTGDFHYNPTPDEELHPGMTLVVLGNINDVVKLRDLVKP